MTDDSIPGGTVFLGRSLRNVSWNFLGGVSAGVLTILATPVYVSRLGLEGYGILGLWFVAQVMMGLMDAGMGATLIKEFAGAREGESGVRGKRDLLRTLEVVYWLLALVFGLTGMALAGPIADRWLTTEGLPPSHLRQILQLMAPTLALQFPFVLYSNGLAGLQRHGRMNILQVAGHALRHGGGVLILLWRPDLRWFFALQVLIALVQTGVARLVTWRLIYHKNHKPTFSFEIINQIRNFSLGMAVTAICGVLLANVDRLALSRLVSASEVGKYALAFTATGLLQLAIQPFYRSYFPVYSGLVADGNEFALRDLYFRSNSLMAMLILPVGVVSAVFAPQLFRAWLGQPDPTSILVFRWLVLGITCSGLMWLPAAFQQAHGWTQLHSSMIAGALILGTCLLVPAIRLWGTPGATLVWVIHGLSGLTLELWLMHRRLLKGQLVRWLRTTLALPLLVSLVVSSGALAVMPYGLGRWGGFVWALGTGVAILVILSGVRLRLHRWAPLGVFFHVGDVTE